LSVSGLSAGVRKVCDEAWERYESYLDDPQHTESLPAFELLSAARAALATAKIPALLELVEDLEEQEEPCVIFSAHRAPIDALAEREGWAVITGDTSATKRTEIEEKFQRGELRGIGATIAAGGTAITLTRASRMIFVDRDWTPALNEQAEDRIHRIGSKKPVLYTNLVADHVLDRRIAEVLGRKRALIDASVDAARLRAGETPCLPR
jgi:SNF2 family DNA or RNA helicase